MKKLIAGLFFTIIVFNAHAEKSVDFYWNFGNVGLGINYSGKTDDNIELTVSAINVTFEHKGTNIGLEFNPIKYWYLFKFQNEVAAQGNGGTFSFINTNIYWDFVKRYSILLGPFMAINYLYVDTSSGFNAHEYILSGGLRFSYRPKYSFFGYSTSQVLNAEIGYRNIMGKNKFYFSINIDVLLAFISAAPAIINKSP